MELHQLRYAVEVHRRGSFTAAAAALHVSQSGVSSQIAKLEKELGTPLFDRGSRTAAPTTAGASLLPLMATVLTGVAQIEQAAGELLGLVRGTVRVGTVIGCTIPGYLNAFAAFRSAYPGVTVSTREGASDRLIAGLRSGDLDLALLAHTGELPVELSAIVLVDEPIAAGVPTDHPWAARPSVSAAEIAATELLTLAAGTGVRSALEQTCGAVGAEAAPAVEAHSPETVLALAERGAGVAVLSRSMITAPLTAVAIRGARHARLSLVSRAAPGNAAQAFIDLLGSELRSPTAA